MSLVFLCHASEDQALAERIQLALANAGHEVFFDQHSLAAGDDFDGRIGRAIKACDVFVFIATPHSVADGRYTLTELKFIRQRWPSPAGRVITVNAGGLAASALPAYLAAATLLESRGNLAAEVRAAVESLLSAPGRQESRQFRGRWYAGAAVLLAVAAVVATLSLGGPRGAARGPLKLADMRVAWYDEAVEYKITDGPRTLEFRVENVRVKDYQVVLMVGPAGGPRREQVLSLEAPAYVEFGGGRYKFFVSNLADYVRSPDKAEISIEPPPP